MAIALVIVGGSLLEPGALSRPPIESSDFPAPIAAVTGSGDALVAMAPPDIGVPVAPQGLAGHSFGPMVAMVGFAAGSLVLTSTFDALTRAAPTSDPSTAELMRAFDHALA